MTTRQPRQPRQPKRYTYYVDVSNIPETKLDRFLKAAKARYKRAKMLNQAPFKVGDLVRHRYDKLQPIRFYEVEDVRKEGDGFLYEEWWITLSVIDGSTYGFERDQLADYYVKVDALTALAQQAE